MAWLEQGRLAGVVRALHRPAVPIRIGRLRALRSAISLALPPAIGRPARTLWGRQRGNSDWLDERWFAERGVHAEIAWAPSSRRVLREMLDHNLRESQVQALVRYQDRDAMAFSVENRVPFLTPPLAQLLFSGCRRSTSWPRTEPVRPSSATQCAGWCRTGSSTGATRSDFRCRRWTGSTRSDPGSTTG